MPAIQLGKPHWYVQLSLLILMCFISACGAPVSEEEREQVYSVVEWNLYYARTEDLNGYMWTLHPESPSYSETETQMAMLFREFDLAYNIDEWEIVSINDQSARVRVVQTTTMIAGTQPFRNNRLEAVHTLRKTADGEWKIYTTEVRNDSIEYLD